MKYSVEGFSQEGLLSFGCDAADAVWLRWFVDWQNTGTMEAVKGKDGLTYYWVDLKYCLSQIPILRITCTAALSRRFKRLVKVGLLKIKTVKRQSQTKLYLALRPENFSMLVMQNSKVRCEKLKSTLSTQLNEGESQPTADLKVRCETTENEISHLTQKYANSSINKEILETMREREESPALTAPPVENIIGEEKRDVFGEFQNVYLSASEFSKAVAYFKQEFPACNGSAETHLRKMIESMSSWQRLHPAKAYPQTEHYAALRLWIQRDKEKGVMYDESGSTMPSAQKRKGGKETLEEKLARIRAM